MLARQVRPAVLVTAVLMVLTGGIYPGVVTGLAQLLFPRQANGSLVIADGRVVGSALIGQPFATARYFHGRPSAAGSGYDAAASSGSNLGPTSARLVDTLLATAVDSEVKLDHAVRGKIPSDLVTASGSGLDPDISPASAYLQAARVARARGLDPGAVRALVERHVSRRAFGVLGDPHVNVLGLNLALDSLVHAAATPPPARARPPHRAAAR